VPDVGVAAHQRNGFAFAGSPDENGDLAHGRWDQLAQSMFDTSNTITRVATLIYKIGKRQGAGT
jgi:hypothetical protein